jgi:hypothetical protein
MPAAPAQNKGDAHEGQQVENKVEDLDPERKEMA